MNVQDYLVSRLRASASHTLELAENERHVQHPGLKGRFRELLIDNLLIPWLPPNISCGTGMIISAENVTRESTQDDIIIFDKTLAPPVLSSPHALEGVFLINSVLARIEVKSTLSRDDIRKFIRSSKEVASLRFAIGPDFKGGNLFGPMNMLFAYDSDAGKDKPKDYQIERVIEVMNQEQAPDNLVSMVCIPEYGLWKIAKDNNRVRWQKLNSDQKQDHLAWFVAILSHTCFREHAKRQGRDPDRGVEGGIGLYIPGGTEIWPWI